jgi:predicted MFS family arabinose efflux permease
VTQQATALHPAHAEKAFSWRFTAPLFLGASLNPINSSMIATALVPIATALRVSVGHTAVLVAALYLASAVAQPTAGKLAEEFGPRRVFTSGIVLVLVGGVVGSLAQNLATLIVARVLIGCGTSCGFPSAMLMIRRRAASAGMTQAPGGVLGGLAIAGTVTAAVGLPIGGLIVGWWGWRSTFLFNVPVALVALTAAFVWIPADAPGSGRRQPAEIARRIDVLGILFFGGAMIALLVFLLSLPRLNYAALAVVVVVAALMLWWELRATTPFIDLRLLASNTALSRTYARISLTYLGVYSVMYGISQWLEASRGYSPEQTGLLILPMTALAALISGPISQRNLIRGPLIAAATSSLIGSVAMLLLDQHSPAVLVVAITLIFGITVGTTAVGNQTALYTEVPPHVMGTAAGLFRTFGYVGSIASSAIISVIFRAKTDDAGLRSITLILIGVSVVVLLMTVLDRQLRSPTRTPARTR